MVCSLVCDAGLAGGRMQVANIEQANHPKADRTVRDGSGFDTNV
jgi:hypothetical protein